MRFPMQLAADPVSNAAFSLFEITSSTSYVDIHGDDVIVQVGNLFRETFLLSNVGKAGLDSWEWYMGLGVRTDFQGTVAPITSFEKVVSFPVLEPRSLFLRIVGSLGLQVECSRLVMSIAQPDEFLIAFNSALHEVTEPGSPEPAELNE
ncbi:MAG: hypothetical protein AAF268_10795 [Cyanobacteria bacterium P01_A01_bin.3]